MLITAPGFHLCPDRQLRALQQGPNVMQSDPRNPALSRHWSTAVWEEQHNKQPVCLQRGFDVGSDHFPFNSIVHAHQHVRHHCYCSAVTLQTQCPQHTENRTQVHTLLIQDDSAHTQWGERITSPYLKDRSVDTADSEDQRHKAKRRRSHARHSEEKHPSIPWEQRQQPFSRRQLQPFHSWGPLPVRIWHLPHREWEGHLANAITDVIRLRCVGLQQHVPLLIFCDSL